MDDVDAMRAFAAESGRFFAREFGMPAAMGVVMGWLMVCDPPERTATELAEELGLSRSAIGGAVTLLERQSMVKRVRRPGDRADRISFDPALWEHTLVVSEQYREQRRLFVRGLELLEHATPERRARLTEGLAFLDFFIEQMPRLREAWERRAAELRARGELPPG